MKYIEELKSEFAGVFGDEFKLEQFRGNSYRLVDSDDIIWMDGIDLNSASASYLTPAPTTVNFVGL